MENNNAPFRVGQKVVAVKDHSQRYFKKGGEFIVLSINKFCCNWVVDIGFLSHSEINLCHSCGNIYQNNGVAFFCTTNFAPIEENRERIKYVAVSETLREKSVEIAAIETN